ncbi:MAG: permease [Chthoniobacterales bacterium]|nr:permease [Chthoniobacterales bacterium]
MSLLSELLQKFWGIFSDMSPYLWAGFFAAFLLRRFIRTDFIRFYLGTENIRSVFYATLIGIPIPLCSCGILPLATTFRRQGASRAAVCAFAISTPQTGVDSFLATGGLLGWPIACLRVLAAFITGTLAGILVALADKTFSQSINQPFFPEQPNPQSLSSKSDSPCPQTSSLCSCSPSNKQFESSSIQSSQTQQFPITSTSHEAAHFAFLRLPADIGPTILLGTFLASALILLIPPNYLQQIPGGKFSIYLGVTIFALPVYVCSTGAIPLAFGMLSAGFPIGSAFILLCAAPSISIASLFTLSRLVGIPALLITILALLSTTWTLAFFLDNIPQLTHIIAQSTTHSTSAPQWKEIPALLLLALFFFSYLQQKFHPQK